MIAAIDERLVSHLDLPVFVATVTDLAGNEVPMRVETVSCTHYSFLLQGRRVSSEETFSAAFSRYADTPDMPPTAHEIIVSTMEALPRGTQHVLLLAG